MAQAAAAGRKPLALRLTGWPGVPSQACRQCAFKLSCCGGGAARHPAIGNLLQAESPCAIECFCGRSAAVTYGHAVTGPRRCRYANVRWLRRPRRGSCDAAGGETRFRFIEIKLSVSRSPRLYSRPLLVRRTDQQHRLVCAIPCPSPASPAGPGPSRTEAVTAAGLRLLSYMSKFDNIVLHIS